MRLEVISISNKLTKWEDETLRFYLKQISSFANITIQNIKPAQGRNLSIREVQILSLIHISEPTRQAEISDAGLWV